MAMMCRDEKKSKEKVHVDVESSSDGPHRLKVSNDQASSDINQLLPLTQEGQNIQKLNPTINSYVIGIEGLTLLVML